MALDSETVVQKVEQAKHELVGAEAALDQAIAAVAHRDRARKEIIGPVIEAAFARVDAARATLLELEALVTKEG